jgi:hypothetical protein
MAIRTVGSLADVQRLAERERRTVTVYAETLPADLPLHFGDTHVELKHVPMAVDREFVMVSDGDEAKSVLHLDDVQAFTDPKEDPDPNQEERYREFLSALADTTFSSLERRHLMAATREFEDRAYRVGDGRLYAGFQRLSKLEEQIPTYRGLGTLGIDVHVYGEPDWAPPYIEGVTVHPVDAAEISESWFIAFDGGGEDAQKCALLADQRGRESFHGIWTYDPDLVDTLIAYLEREYGG